MSRPDFYLASSEGYDLEQPRACWRVKRLSADRRDDLLLVRIVPALRDGSNTVDLVILATRHKGDSLFPITSWPVFVHVAVPLVSDPERYDTLKADQLKSVAWAELYENEEDARLKTMPR